MSDPSKTVQFNFTPGTKSFAHIVDDNFTAALETAAQGGDSTQQWFDSQNQTADFWNWMANPDENQFAPGVDPDGNQILMASNYGVDMRQGAFYRGDSDTREDSGNGPPEVGLATIDLYNHTSNVSRTMTFTMSAVGFVPSGWLSLKVFRDLIQPTLKNCATFVKKISGKFQQEAQEEPSDIDPVEAAEGPAGEASDVVESVGGEAAEEGLEYLAIDWSNVGLEVAGLGTAAALPLVLSFIGHQMICQVEIHNLTDTDFTWDLLSQVHGKASVMPKDQTARTIPKMDYNVDHWGDRTTVKCAYFDTFSFINSTDLGKIGVVLGLTPSDGSPQAKLVADIPFSGNNTIWVGQSDDDPGTIYDNHSTPDQRLKTTADFDTYTVTWSINRLSGTTSGAYYYGIIGVIEPKS